MLKQSHVFLPFFYNFCQHSLIYLFLLGLVTCSLALTFWLSVSLGVQEQDLWHAQIIIGSSLSLRWYMYQIGRNSGIVLSFLNYFFTVFFLCFLQETERPMHLSYRETNYKKRVEQVVCSIAVSFNIFSQPNFLTKQLKNFLSDKQSLRF